MTAGGEDYDTVIQRIDPNSKLRMADAGAKPANPFPNEQAFEESLEVSHFAGMFAETIPTLALFMFIPYIPPTYAVSGHQGRFAASHAMACQGKICQYQIQRRYVLAAVQ